MTLTTIYVARHGYRSNWLPPPHPKPPTGIDSDPALAPHGVEQAKELANYVFSIQPHPEMIFSSPFYRCVETAHPLAQMLEVPVNLERGLGEWYKKDRGVIPEPATADLLFKFFPTVNTDLGKWDGKTVVPSLEGESEEEIFARCQNFIEEFIPKFEKKYPHIETVMFITHAATKIAFAMALLKYTGVKEFLRTEHCLEVEEGLGESREHSLQRVRAGACSLDKFVLNGNKWDFKMNGNTKFLSKGEEMNWNFAHAFEAGSDEDIKARKHAAEALEQYQDVYISLELPPGTNASQFEARAESYSNAPSLDLQPSAEEFSSSQWLDSSVVSSTFHNIEPSANFACSGFNTAAPLVQIRDKIYQGEWESLNGTEMVFDETGELLAKVSQRVKLTPGRLVPKSKQEDEFEVQGGFRNKFLNRALIIARERENEEMDVD